jgi:hypothetical protein
MHKFEYRAPRFSVDLPVRLTLQNSTLAGRCREISKEGMRLDLPQPLPADACGTVAMSYHEETLELNVRVAHTGTVQKGLEFLYSSEKERNAVARLIASLAEGQNRPGPVLLG